MKSTTNMIVLGLLAIVVASGCSGLKPHSAPFYAYNSSLLNQPNAGALEGHKIVGPVLLVDPNSAYASADTPEADEPAPAPDEFEGTDVEPLESLAAAPVVAAAPAPAPKAAPVVAAPAPKAAPVVAAPVEAAPVVAAAPAPKASDVVSAPAAEPKTLAAAKLDTQDSGAESHTASYLRATYEANGVSFAESDDEGVAALHQAVKQRGTIYHATRPAVGDIVFFHNTFDRNGDGRNNDWYTHAGLVENVEDDGTIHVLTYSGGRVDSFAMNLEQPGLATDERSGKVWNTSVRHKDGDDAPFTQYLAGELFAGFGNLLGDRTELVVIDNWRPGMMISQR